MPWTKRNPPASAKNFTEKGKEIVVRVANKELAGGADEASAIRQGLAAAKRAGEGPTPKKKD